jgi:hypothetical protein
MTRTTRGRRAVVKHGATRNGRVTPEYLSWARAIQRCHNRNNPGFHNYGGRGLRMCEGWRHDFPAFLKAVSLRPSPCHSLDRVDNNRGYVCGNCADCRRHGDRRMNCRWATPAMQSRNQRKTRFLTHRGETKCLKDWCNLLSVSPVTVARRLDRGWSVADALETPSLKKAAVITFRGKSRTIEQWAKALGLTWVCMYTRLLRWPLERAFGAPSRKRDTTVTFRGESRTEAEWARSLGIRTTALRERLAKWPLERALTLPRTEPVVILLTLGRRSLTARQWDETRGFPLGTVIHRVRLGWTVERAITTPVRKYRGRAG